MESKIVPLERIEQRIFLLRGQKVMLSTDLAELYGIQTKVLNQAVRRNACRFPSDFMFHLAPQEVAILRSQIVTSRWGGHRYALLAFTEQGVAMLSSVLNSERAIRVNIEVMRAFVALRKMLSSHIELEQKIADLEKKYDKQFRIVFEAIRELMAEPEPVKKKQIGFHVRERRAQYGRIQKAETKI